MTTSTAHEHEVKIQALRTSVFGRLSARQLDDIASLSDICQVRCDATLCAEGEFGQTAFVVASGQVAVEAGGVEVARCGAGDLIGDWALFTDGYRSATLRALSEVEVVVVDPRDIDSLLMAEPAAASQVGPRSAH